MIELKKNQLKDVYGILDKISLNKITNPEIRKDVLKLVLKLNKSISAIDEDLEHMRLKYFEDFSDSEKQNFQSDLLEITVLLQNKKYEEAKIKDNAISEKYPELTKAYVSLNNDINVLKEEVVSFDLEKLDSNDFIDAMVGQPINISMRELHILKPIFNEFED